MCNRCYVPTCPGDPCNYSSGPFPNPCNCTCKPKCKSKSTCKSCKPCNNNGCLDYISTDCITIVGSYPCLEVAAGANLTSALAKIENLCDRPGSCQVLVDDEDECCGYLSDKLIAGDNVTITVEEDGDCKTMILSTPDPTPLLTIQDGVEDTEDIVEDVTLITANGFLISAGAAGEAIIERKISLFGATPETIPHQTANNFSLATAGQAHVMVGSANGSTPTELQWAVTSFDGNPQNDANITYDSGTGRFIVNDLGIYNISGYITLRPGGNAGGATTRWGSAGWIKAGFTLYGTGNVFVDVTVPMFDTLSGIQQGSIAIYFERKGVVFTAGQAFQFRVLNGTGTDYADHNPDPGSGGQDIMTVMVEKIFDRSL